jgi:hypothetical protein
MYQEKYAEKCCSETKNFAGCETKTQPAYDSVPYDSVNCCNGYRQSGRNALEVYIRNLRLKAEQLQLISDSLPAVLSDDQDNALWSLSGFLKNS